MSIFKYKIQDRFLSSAGAKVILPVVMMWVLLLGLSLDFPFAYADSHNKENKSKNEKVISMQGISVTGNNEQPKVLYLVPWQPPTVLSEVSDPPIRMLPNAIIMKDPIQNGKEIFFRKHLKVEVQTLKTH